MKYLGIKRRSGLSWKTKLLVYLATILLCVLAANFRTEIQQLAGNSHNQNAEISILQE